MVVVALLLILAGLAGLINPAWIRQRSRGAAAVVLVVGIVLAGIGGGGDGSSGGAGGGATSTSEPSRQAESPAETGPSDPESPATPVIPGLTAADVTANMEEQGFECSGPEQLQTQIAYTCSWSDGLMDMTVDVYGTSPTQVTLVEATVTDAAPDVRAGEMAAFLGFVATLPYDGAEPEKARSWVEKHFDAAGQQGNVQSATFGPVLYEMYGTERGRFLELKPAGG